MAIMVLAASTTNDLTKLDAESYISQLVQTPPVDLINKLLE